MLAIADMLCVVVAERNTTREAFGLAPVVIFCSQVGPQSAARRAF